MTTDTYISDEMRSAAIKAFDRVYYGDAPDNVSFNLSFDAALEAIAPMLIREGMERAAKVAEEADVYWNGVAYDRRQSGRDDSFACASASSAVKIATAIRAAKEEV